MLHPCGLGEEVIGVGVVTMKRHSAVVRDGVDATTSSMKCLGPKSMCLLYTIQR